MASFSLPTPIFAVILFFHALAILSTCFRLFHRLQTRRLWWDDFWAFVALLSTGLLMGLFAGIPISVLLSRLSIGQLWFWGQTILFTTALWSSRITVAVTIVRLLPMGSLRRISAAVAVLFGMMWASLIIQKLALCVTFQPTDENPLCPIPRSVAFLELSTDISADVWLIGSPAYMLWQMKLPRQHHRLIFAIFICGLFVTGASIAHSVFILENKQASVGISGHLEVAISLIVCNLIVVVTYIYRVFWKGDNDSTVADTNTTSASERRSSQRIHSSQLSSSLPPSMSFTTVMTDSSFDRSLLPISSHGTFPTSMLSKSSVGHFEMQTLPRVSEQSNRDDASGS